MSQRQMLRSWVLFGYVVHSWKAATEASGMQNLLADFWSKIQLWSYGLINVFLHVMGLGSCSRKSRDESSAMLKTVGIF